MTNNQQPTAEQIIEEATKMLPIWKKTEDIMPVFGGIALCVEHLLEIIYDCKQRRKRDYDAAVLQSKEIADLKEKLKKAETIISTLTV